MSESVLSLDKIFQYSNFWSNSQDNYEYTENNLKLRYILNYKPITTTLYKSIINKLKITLNSISDLNFKTCYDNIELIIQQNPKLIIKLLNMIRLNINITTLDNYIECYSTILYNLYNKNLLTTELLIIFIKNIYYSLCFSNPNLNGNISELPKSIIKIINQYNFTIKNDKLSMGDINELHTYFSKKIKSNIMFIGYLYNKILVNNNIFIKILLDNMNTIPFNGQHLINLNNFKNIYTIDKKYIINTIKSVFNKINNDKSNINLYITDIPRMQAIILWENIFK